MRTLDNLASAELERERVTAGVLVEDLAILELANVSHAYGVASLRLVTSANLDVFDL